MADTPLSPTPFEGGSYSVDPATGALVRNGVDGLPIPNITEEPIEDIEAAPSLFDEGDTE